MGRVASPAVWPPPGACGHGGVPRDEATEVVRKRERKDAEGGAGSSKRPRLEDGERQEGADVPMDTTHGADDELPAPPPLAGLVTKLIDVGSPEA